MINAVFGKTMENLRNFRDIKLATTERRRNYVVWELNYHATKFFIEHLLAIEMKKTQIIMSNPDYLGLSSQFYLFDISKTKMYDFCYNY